MGEIGKNKKLQPQNRLRLIAASFVCISATVFMISALVYIFLASIIEFGIRKQSVLNEGAIILEKWSNPEYFIRTKMFTYSVRNPDEVTHGAAPSVKRVGPYAFDQVQKRKIHRIGNGSLRYETIQSYFFNGEASCDECFLYNRIWIPNLVYQKFVEAASKPEGKPALAAVVVQTPFLEVEVAELLYDGYKDPFLDQVCSLPVVNFVCEQILHLPDRIGLFFKKNGTANGVYEVEDGSTENAESLGRIKTWNDSPTLPDFWWEGVQALKINGSDGSLLPPYVGKNERLRVFVADMCRSLDFVFQKEVTYAGIPAYRFIVPRDNWDWDLDWNKGFCNTANGKQLFREQQSPKCLPNGLLDVSRCQTGEPPIVVSQPNFMYAPEFVQNSIDGIRKPVQELDQIEIDIEPRLGTILQAHRRFLISISMWRGDKLPIPDLVNFRNSVVPVLEVDEHIHIDDSNLELIKSKLIRVEKAVSLGCIFTAIISLVALAFITAMYFFYWRNKSDTRADLVSPIPLSSNGMSNGLSNGVKAHP